MLENIETKNEIINTYKMLEMIDGAKFTKREIDIISCLVNGKSTKLISIFLSISPKTVESNIYNIMAKLDCNSRKYITEFIENSGSFLLIRRHYIYLQVQNSYKVTINKISNIFSKKNIKFFIIYKESLGFFVNRLEYELKNIGLEVKLLNQNIFEEKFYNQEINFSDFNKYIFVDILENNIILKKNVKYISSNEFQKDYNNSILNLLLEIELCPSIKSIIYDFKNEYDVLNRKIVETNSYTGSKTEIMEIEKKPYKLLHFGIKEVNNILKLNIFKSILIMKFFILIIIMSYLHKEKVFFYFNKNIFFLKKTSEKLINRPYLISKIENVFKNQRGLKIVALIGVGGVGKTTLAHQYAMTQKNSFIWEINASCEESILTSFENLLHFMAVKNQDNIFMKNILFLNNKKLRKDSILYLIKNILKSKKEWILIYDNFEDISKLKDYFPNNIEEWGNGKVIITSQNKNIINIIDLKNIIELGEISKEEKIKIFLNINNNNTKKDLLYFVQKLPPFPLDISIASYYIKITGISHKRYLLYLNSYDKDFINMQKKIASEIGFYDKIRYDIIKLSLEKIIEENKKFLDLIFFISFLSPDNIPMIVLEHNTSPIVIDSFIYNLKRYSFLTKENNIINSNIKTISLHKSIQEMIYKYINQNITLVNIKKIINIMLLSLEKISNEAIENNNYKLIKILIEHFEQILNRNTSLLNESEINYLKLNLGILYFYDKNYSKSKNLLENVKYINDKRKLAKKLICLGDIYRQLGYYEKSENLLKKGVQIYKNNYFKEKDKNLPWSLAYLGNFYRSIGNYGMARNVLEESLFIYKEKYHLNKRNVAQVMTLLQYVYTDLGDYEKAKDLLKNSLDIYKEVDCKNYVIIGWILSLLGNIYQKQNNDSRAINFLEEGLYIYKKLIPSDHFSIAWIYGYLGNVYIKIREFEKANNFLSKALSIYKKNCRKDHPKVAWIIALYGNFYEAQGNNRKAKELLEKSFNIYQKNFSQYHINVAWVLLCLGRVYTKLEDYKNAKYFLEKSLLVYRKNLLHNHENVIILKKLLKINNSRLKEASGYVACSKMKCHTVKGVLVD